MKKNFKALFFLAFACSIVNVSFGQVDVNRFQNIISAVSGGSFGAGYKGRYNAAGKIKGDPYLDSAFTETKYEFHRTNTYFSGPSRFDILNDEFEVKTTGGIRVIKSNLVKGYKIVENGDSISFVSTEQFKNGEADLTGYFRVLSAGKAHLLEHTRIEIVKPSYNPSLEVGDKNSHLVKKETTYFAIDGTLNKLKGKKEILKAFGADAEKVNTFIQSEKLGTKDENDLVRIFNYYNSLSK